METKIQVLTFSMAYLPTKGKHSPNGRELKKMVVYDLLERLEIPYLRVDHEVANTVKDCHNVDEILGVHICKIRGICAYTHTRRFRKNGD